MSGMIWLQGWEVVVCVSILKGFLQWLPYSINICLDCLLFFSKHDLKTHTALNTPLYPNAQGQNKDMFIACKSLNIIQRTCTRTHAWGKSFFALSLKLMVRQSKSAKDELWACNPVQGQCQTNFSPRWWQISSLLIYRECWVYIYICLKYFTQYNHMQGLLMCTQQNLMSGY